MTEWDAVFGLCPEEGFSGRRKILTDKKEITDSNVIKVLENSLAIHRRNCREIVYLERFYRGIQDIRHREKIVRPNINNKITVNVANEIVTFKTAFFIGTPMQYIAAVGDENVIEQVRRLNRFMRSEDRDSKDKELCDWFHICGVSERLVLQNKNAEKNECPIVIYTLHPCEAFVIYYSGIGQKPLAGVIIQRDEDGKILYNVYTEYKFYEIKENKIVRSDVHTFGGVPLVEYLNNEARIGAFEIVLPMLNAINTLESNRLDDTEQFVQSILVLKNCEIDEEKAAALRENLGLMIKSDPANPADVFRVDGELSQSGAQLQKDDLYDSILTICGMPNRNGGSSTSDTGMAVVMRDGWSSAESRANDTQKMFDRADKQFLKIVLKICNDSDNKDFHLDLKLSDIKQEHPRNNLSSMQSQMQVLCEGLNNPKIHPRFPWIISGMPNAEEWYRKSMEYYEEQQREMQRQLTEEIYAHSEGDISADGQGDRTSLEESGATI